jgi:hypothetical protein
MQAKLDTLQSTVDALAASFSSFQSSTSTTVAALQATISTNKVQVDTLQGVVATQSSLLASLQSLTSSQGSTIVSQASTIAAQSTLLASQGSSIGSLSSSLGVTNTRLTNVEFAASNTSFDVQASYNCTASGKAPAVAARSVANPHGCIAVAVAALSDSECTSKTLGLLRTNTSRKVLDMCDGTAFVGVSRIVRLSRMHARTQAMRCVSYCSLLGRVHSILHWTVPPFARLAMVCDWLSCLC